MRQQSWDPDLNGGLVKIADREYRGGWEGTCELWWKEVDTGGGIRLELWYV